MGWLHKSNFYEIGTPIEVHTTKLRVARHLARLLLTNHIKLYSQWLNGHRNGLADALSHNNSTMSIDDLTHHLIHSFPSQVPSNFKIYPLPSEIESFIYSLLQNLPKMQPQPQVTNTSVLERGKSGSSSSSQYPSQMIHYSQDSPSTTEMKSLPYLPKLYDPHPKTVHQLEFHNCLRINPKCPQCVGTDLPGKQCSRPENRFCR